jgi:hypothetical protein
MAFENGSHAQPAAEFGEKGIVSTIDKSNMEMVEMATFLYNDYILRLSRRLEANLTYLEAYYNFDYGPEFEIALCKILRAVLPQNYGICRGHVVDDKGSQAGDNIVIYDRVRFATLRSLAQEDYAQQEWIPIEAVYAYFETKHSVNAAILTDEEKESEPKDGTLYQAAYQASEVKKLCESRKPLSITQLTPYLKLNAPQLLKPPHSFPDKKNPLFSGILIRNITNGSKQITTSNEAVYLLRAFFEAGLPKSISHLPDLIIFGPNVVTLPVFPSNDPEVLQFQSPFLIPPLSHYCHCVDEQPISFGLGMASLLFALDWIQLGKLNWSQIIVDAVHPDEKTRLSILQVNYPTVPSPPP